MNSGHMRQGILMVLFAYKQREVLKRSGIIARLNEINQIRRAFANVLVKRRSRKKWSQVELGGYSGLDNSYISRLEKGLMTPTLDAMLRLARAFEIVPERLMKEIRMEIEKLRD